MRYSRLATIPLLLYCLSILLVILDTLPTGPDTFLLGILQLREVKLWRLPCRGEFELAQRKPGSREPAIL